jgi:hypothetical protein
MALPPGRARLATRRTATRVTPGAILLEQPQPFSAHAVFVDGEPGRVTAWLCQARDETGADRIDDGGEHDRNGSRRLQQRCHGCGAGRSQEDIGCERDQFRRMSVNVVSLGPADIDPQVAALAPS